MLGKPRLRDSHLRTRPYPIGMLTNESIIKIGRSLTYQMAVGETDLSGEKWEKIFSDAIGGCNLSRPLGLADVVMEDFAWSVKTVKNTNPHKAKNVRIISGRNNVTYSFGIENPLEDIKVTGEAVLRIFNERINTAKSEYKDITHSILVRSNNLSSYTYFEKEASIVDPKKILWKLNKRGNLEGFNEENKHIYTWQPNGSQFTIIYDIPEDAQKFTLRKPESLDFNSVIELVGFNTDWVNIK